MIFFQRNHNVLFYMSAYAERWSLSPCVYDNVPETRIGSYGQRICSEQDLEEGEDKNISAYGEFHLQPTCRSFPLIVQIKFLSCIMLCMI